MLHKKVLHHAGPVLDAFQRLFYFKSREKSADQKAEDSFAVHRCQVKQSVFVGHDVLLGQTHLLEQVLGNPNMAVCDGAMYQEVVRVTHVLCREPHGIKQKLYNLTTEWSVKITGKSFADAAKNIKVLGL